MRALSQIENLSLTAVLKMEADALIMGKAIGTLITDEDLKRKSDSDVLATEGRIKGIQQFIEENNISVAEED